MTIKSKVIKFTTAASFAVAGIATLSAAKLNSLSFNGTAQASTLQAPAKEIGVVKVNSKTGESIAVWNSYEDGKQQTGKYLPYQHSARAPCARGRQLRAPSTRSLRAW